ncbi:uncharacterized protein [Argopecten irradians]|uniref:uncharacterized protein n=1 Tax=Argopecten irradians TaxID=31199 RepID=UPI003722792D
MKRRRLGHPQSGIFQCELCNFETGKHANFLRHLETDKHTRNASYVCGDGLRPPCPENDNDNELEATLPAVEESNHGEPIPYEDSGSESEVGHSYNEDSRIDFQVQQETCTWFPFSSKLEMLLYVMLHSKTHIMSDETAKFVWYIMKEAGINMPPFSLIKGMRFGELTPESLLQQGKGEDGSPFWFLKPSALVGLAVSHPETSNQLIRYGRFSSSPHRISEQADSKKWLQQMHAVSAKKRNGILYAGDFAIDVVTNQIGRITNFLQDYESNTIYAQLSMLESMGPNRTKKVRNKTYFCQYCLQGFVREDLLDKHVENRARHDPQCIEFPENDMLKFEDFRKQLKAPFVLFCDFEAFVQPMDSCENDPKFSVSETTLLLRKGVYPYEYLDCAEKFTETQLPSKECFYSSLTKSHISEKDYVHAQKVWKEMKINNLGEYQDLYLKTDVLLLADVFENFRAMCLGYYGLDAAHFFTAPGLVWSSALRMTRVSLDLIKDPDMYLFFEVGIRGGVSMISNKYAEANNPRLSDTNNPLKPTSYIMYSDCNNLYGKAMSEPLPAGGFR